MHTLSPSQLLQIWEKGKSLSPIERSHTLLTMALPHLTMEQINQLSVGECHQQLLNIRTALFGKLLDCLADCPECEETLEFTLDADDWSSQTEAAQDFTIQLHDKTCFFRLITLADLKQAAQEKTPAAAAKILIERCLTNPENHWDTTNLSDDTLEALAEQLKRHDPAAEWSVNLSCPACEASWQMSFNITAFLWDEIQAYAKELLQQIHCLAQAYGWNENTIFKLSDQRRQYYLNQVLQ